VDKSEFSTEEMTMKRLAITAALALACASAIAQTTPPPVTATATFTCTPPTQREDGTPLLTSEIANYNLYEISIAGVVGAKAATFTTCGGTLPTVSGTKRYVISTVDKLGLETLKSNMVLITTVKGKAITDLQVRVSYNTTAPTP